MTARVAVAVAAIAVCWTPAWESIDGAEAVAGGSSEGSSWKDAQTRAVAELGRRLFFDPSASRSGMVACADCHEPEHGFSDRKAKSADVRGPTPRHSQTLIDCGARTTLHWDGALRHLEDLAKARVEPETKRAPKAVAYYGAPSPEPAAPAFLSEDTSEESLPAVATVLSQSGRYRDACEAAFSTPDFTDALVEKAIAGYCRSIRSGTSAYDRFAAGAANALSPSARRGLDLFGGSAGCAGCHRMDGDRAALTDDALHAIDAPDASGRPGAQFKTPTLRDVARRGPYFHDARFSALEPAIRFFWREATDAEVVDLAAFLGALTSDERPGLAPRAWSARATRTRLRFVDADRKPLAKWPVTLSAAGDAVPLDGTTEPIRLVTDAEGWVDFRPPPTTHARIVLDGGLRPAAGCWIPDTCRQAEIRLPIRGTARMVVRFPPGVAAPESLELEHAGAAFMPEQRLPRTMLGRESEPEVDAEGSRASYSGPLRTDVTQCPTLLIPPGLAGEFGGPVQADFTAERTSRIRLVQAER